MRRRRYIWIVGHLAFMLAGLTFSGSAFSQNECWRDLVADSQKVLEIRQRLREEIQDAPKVIGNLRISSEGLRIHEPLGVGASGFVLKVSLDQRLYALKVYSKHILFEAFDIYDAVIIQRLLGELGMAPKVIGVLDAKTAAGWTKENLEKIRKFFPALGVYPSKIQFGLLMELTNPLTLKNHSFCLKSDLYDCLVQQAETFDQILESLSVYPMDPDAVITSDQNLKLIDLTWYRFSERTQRTDTISALFKKVRMKGPR